MYDANVNVKQGGRKRRQTKGGKKQKRKNKGGSFLADVSVPAGLLLLNQFMKHRKSKKASKSRKRKSRKTRR